jgi:hypothetical protein
MFEALFRYYGLTHTYQVHNLPNDILHSVAVICIKAAERVNENINGTISFASLNATTEKDYPVTVVIMKRKELNTNK